MTKFCRVHNCTHKTQVDKSLYFLCSLENCHKSLQEEEKNVTVVLIKILYLLTLF